MKIFAALSLTLFLAGCSCAPIEVGPIEVVINAGETTVPSVEAKVGVIDTSVPLTAVQMFCELPTESELQNSIESVEGIDVAEITEVTAIKLVETRIEALEGDFNFFSAVTTRFRPVNGFGDPFILGAASAPQGLGTMVRLLPPVEVDLLDVMRANEDAPLGLCPALESEFSVILPPPLQVPVVRFKTSIVVEIYAEIAAF